MADYTAVGRTNYFKVKGEETFLQFLNDSGLSSEILRSTRHGD